MWPIVLACFVALSCDGPSSAVRPTVGPEEGTYVLVTVDGKTLPARLAEGGMLVEVDSATLTLGNGGSLRMSTSFRVGPEGRAATNVVTGSYAMNGAMLTFTYQNGGRNAGSLSGSTLQMTNEDLVWVFRKT